MEVAMKKILLILSLLFVSTLYGQESYEPQAEIHVQNLLNEELFVKFYPISTVFSGSSSELLPTLYDPETRLLRRPNPNPDHRRRRSRIDPNNNYPLNYVIGLDGYALNNPYDQDCIGFYKIQIYNGNFNTYNNWLLIDHEGSSGYEPGLIDGLAGYGIYRLEVYRRDPHTQNISDHLFDVLIDWMDFNYPYGAIGTERDLIITVRSTTGTDPSNTFRWKLGGNDYPLFGQNSPVNGHIQVYRQYKYFNVMTL
jgi:hypothetical protein